MKDILEPRIFFEEEEGGGGGGGYYYTMAPKDIEQLRTWWDHNSSTYKKESDCYAVFLASKADAAVCELINEHRTELSEISGNDCCFIYFRDYENARNLKNWTIDEHFRFSSALTRLLNVQQVPAVIFFEDLDDDFYRTMPLADMSAVELLQEFRNLFVYLHNGRDSDVRVIDRIGDYKTTQTLKGLVCSAGGKTKALLDGLLKSMLKPLADIVLGTG